MDSHLKDSQPTIWPDWVATEGSPFPLGVSLLTGEANQLGPTYSFRGIDDSTYYMQSADARSPYLDFSGCGNTLDTEDRAVRQLIVDSLRYWDREMHVDGFRFDLASVFARNSDGSLDLDEPPLFGQITADPELSSVRLIAEPWDASDGFLLERKFPGQMWLQWNSKYRETLQRFVRGDKGLVGELMTRLYGTRLPSMAMKTTSIRVIRVQPCLSPTRYGQQA